MKKDIYYMGAGIVLLFILFLFSGGIYEYSESYKYQLCVNKITGTVEKNSENGLINILK